MWIAVSAATMFAAFAGCFALVAVARRRPFGAAVALAAALLVVLEAALLDLLSGFHAVGRPALLAGNLAIAAAGLVTAGRRLQLVPRLRFLAGQARLVWLAPIALPAALSAVAYVPNNWDSMTYHLARVAYWLQAGSVGAYPTSIDRQIALPPGDEYLLLALQGIAGSDRLANLLQFAAWIALVFALPPLVRAFGAPRSVARWAGLLAATAPEAVLQASSTQNDGVTALLAVGIVCAAVPFLHRTRRWRRADIVLLIIAGSAGVLVKPTAVVVAAPFVAWALVASARSLCERKSWAELGISAAVGLALSLAAISPALASRSSLPDAGGVTREYVYAGLEEPVDRLMNALRGAARHVPLPEAVADWIAPEKTTGCPRAHSLCAELLFRFHEDTTGNIGQAVIAIALLIAGALRWRDLSRRARTALLCVPLGWFLFHAIFRDNIWFTRLQLPLFGLLPLLLVAAVGPRSRRALMPVAMALIAWATVVACNNEARPPSLDPGFLAAAGSPTAYYVLAPSGVREMHAFVLKSLAASQCRRLGVYLGGDSYDYPLAWRAMQAGAEVRHLVASDHWACAAFSESWKPPPGAGWRAVMPFLYVR